VKKKENPFVGAEKADIKPDCNLTVAAEKADIKPVGGK